MASKHGLPIIAWCELTFRSGTEKTMVVIRPNSPIVSMRTMSVGSSTMIREIVEAIGIIIMIRWVVVAISIVFATTTAATSSSRITLSTTIMTTTIRAATFALGITVRQVVIRGGKISGLMALACRFS